MIGRVHFNTKNEYKTTKIYSGSVEGREYKPGQETKGTAVNIATRLSGFVDDSRVSPFTAIELSKVLVVIVLPL